MTMIETLRRYFAQQPAPPAEPPHSHLPGCVYHELYASPNEEQRLYFVVKGRDQYSIEVAALYHFDGDGILDQPWLTKDQVLTITDRIRELV